MGYKGELGFHSLIMIDDITNSIGDKLIVAFLGVLEQNPCCGLVLVVKIPP
jgi:hypothetical protein